VRSTPRRLGQRRHTRRILLLPCWVLPSCGLAWLPRGHVRVRRAPTLIRTRGANAALAVRGGRACRHRTASCTAGNTGRCWASQTLLATHPRKESNTCAGFLNLKCTLKMQPEQSEASAACSKDHVSKSRAAGKKKSEPNGALNHARRATLINMRICR